MLIKTIAFVSTLIIIGNCVFAWLTSVIVSTISVYHLCLNRISRDDRLIILHCVNLFMFVIIYTTVTVLFHIQTILGDLYGYNFQSKSCTFLGYVLLVISSTIYMASVTQAFYRLSRVVYQRCRWLQQVEYYIVLPFIQVIISLSLISPLFVWNAVIYLPDEYYCFVPYTDFRSILWAVFSIYIIPIVCIILIYYRITTFIKQEGNNQTMIIRQRQKRDVLAIRRILTTVSLLTLAGAPAAIFLIGLIITGKIHPLTFRVAWLGASISMIGLSVTLVFSVPQLKSIVLKSVIGKRESSTANNTSDMIEMTNGRNIR